MTVFDNVKVGDYIPEDAFPDLDGPDVCDYWDTQAKYGCVRLTGHAGPHMDTYDDSDGLPPRMREVAWVSGPQHVTLADGCELRELTLPDLLSMRWCPEEGSCWNEGRPSVTGNACGTGGN